MGMLDLAGGSRNPCQRNHIQNHEHVFMMSMTDHQQNVDDRPLADNDNY